MDVSSVETILTAGVAGAGLLGAAALGVMGTAAIWKYVRRAL